MADRRVTKAGKDPDGDIVSLCNPSEDWSPRGKAGAIADIESHIHSYYVSSSAGRSDIIVVHGATGKYLRTDPNGSAADNLDNLPDC